jgi:thiol:disulfide interchange protein
MGFLLLVAAAYFAAGRLIHGPSFWWAVAATVVVSSLFLMVRTIQLAPRARPIMISALIAVLGVGGSVATAVTLNAHEKDWTSYSVDAFESARSSNQIILVKFTANWCATCHVIEATVFRDPGIWAALKQHNVLVLKADMSKDDSPAHPLLLKLNPAGGIPLTAIFVPGREAPILISSVYTSETLMAALAEATASKAPTVAHAH